MHRPSAAHAWHIPATAPVPKPPGVFFLELPLVEHEASIFGRIRQNADFVCCRHTVYYTLV